MTDYVLTPEAEQDIDAIRTWLMQQDGPRLVRHVFERLQRGMALIGRKPAFGHPRKDLTDEPVLFWSVFSYLIVYDPEPRPVRLVRVVHASRDVAEVLKPP